MPNWLTRLWQPDMLVPILWTAGAAVIILLVGRLIERGVLRGMTNIDTRHRVRRGISWSRTALFLLIVILIWGKITKDVGVFLGIVGAGVALSLQETMLCIVGWGLIVIKKPFDIGDRIEIGSHAGDVIDVAVFHTTLLEIGNWVHDDQSTGRVVHVPNSMFFRSVCFNYTKGFPFLWNELSTVVTFESDWRKAKEIILRQADAEADKIAEEVRPQIEEMQRRYAIHYHRLTPIVYTSIADQGICLTLRYLTPVRKRRTTSHLICEGILKVFGSEPNIDFAYPTTRFYTSASEPRPHAPNMGANDRPHQTS